MIKNSSKNSKNLGLKSTPSGVLYFELGILFNVAGVRTPAIPF
jgi:hypothetical protein